MGSSQQQQQSNTIKPQKVNGAKLPMVDKKVKVSKSIKPMIDKSAPGMDAPMKVKKTVKSVSKVPSYSKVENSVRKTMGY